MPVLVLLGCLLFYFFFVPFVQWLFVEKTLEVYHMTSDNFSSDEFSISYQGVMADTIFRPSASQKRKVDTIVHRQTICLEPQEKSSDNKTKIEDFGAFSDGAGLLNAFFSFLAFVAVLVTIYIQNRKDLYEKENDARVQFEQEFFAMVEMLENIVSHLHFSEKIDNEISYVDNKTIEKTYKGAVSSSGNNNFLRSEIDPTVVEGREVFKYIYKDRKDKNLYSFVNSMEDLRLSSDAQEMCFDGTLDHYFRYLYRILKHIDESKLLNRLDNPQEEREYYAHILRAQLSNYELLMLFYNGLLGENVDTIKKLIERYAMFNNLRSLELGVYQSAYYQRIQNDKLYEEPANYNAERDYSITAFWDEKKLKEFKQRSTNSDEKGLLFRLKHKLALKCPRNIVLKSKQSSPSAPENNNDFYESYRNGEAESETIKDSRNDKISGKRGNQKIVKKRKHRKRR